MYTRTRNVEYTQEQFGSRISCARSLYIRLSQKRTSSRLKKDHFTSNLCRVLNAKCSLYIACAFTSIAKACMQESPLQRGKRLYAISSYSDFKSRPLSTLRKELTDPCEPLLYISYSGARNVQVRTFRFVHVVICPPLGDNNENLI